MKGWVGLVSWLLTYSGRFTHINGYPSAAGQVQARESSPVRDQRSTTELHLLAIIDKIQKRRHTCSVGHMERMGDNWLPHETLHCYIEVSEAEEAKENVDWQRERSGEEKCRHWNSDGNDNETDRSEGI